MYDPTVGRFMGVDPLAEKYNSWSPYTYTLNNPVKYIDPDGRETTYADRNGNILFVSNDMLDDRIVVVNDGNKDAFFQRLDAAHSKGTNVHGDSFNKQLRGLGQNYLVDGIIDFYDDNKSDIVESKNYILEDGTPLKGPAEHGSFLYLDGKNIVIGCENLTDKNPHGIFFNMGDAESSGAVSRLHTHGINKVFVTNKNTGQFGLMGPGDNDPSLDDILSHKDNKQGFHNVVVTDKYIFLYNGYKCCSEITKVPRSNFKR